MTTPPDQMLVNFRDTLWRSVPPWLKTGNAQRYLYALGVQIDAFADALLAGVKMRFPNLYSADSLQAIGSERRLARGLSESDENYAARLNRWLVDHRRRGGPYALLTQLYYHYAPDTFPITLAYPSGTSYALAPDGTITYTTFSPPNLAPAWAHWTLFYFTDQFTAADADDLLLIPREWIAAHCLGEIVIMPAGAELWNYPAEWLWNDSLTWNSADTGFRVQVK